jgi:hypothetical protein
VLFLSVLVRNARYEKRTLIKMVFFLSIFGVLKFFNTFSAHMVGELFIFPVLYYLFIFEHSCGVNSLIQEHFTGENS